MISNDYVVSFSGSKHGCDRVVEVILLAALAFGILCPPATAQLLDMIANYYGSHTYQVSPHNFYEYLYIGGQYVDPDTMSAPPHGDGVLKGQFTCQNKPAKGLTLSLTLNSKYEVDNLLTDEEGVFTVSLPTGEWLINSVQTESWEDKPETGNFSLFYGGEEKLTGDSYSRHTFFGNRGYAVNVTTDASQIHLAIAINKDLEMIWPDIGGKVSEATIQDVIKWEPYPNAAKYYVEIQKIERKGSTTSFSPIISEVLVNQNALPLTGLNHVAGSGKKAAEYGVEIFAFSEDGALIAESPETYGESTFVLSDGNVLVEDRLEDVYDLASIGGDEAFEVKIEAIMQNERRAEAVLVLIEENMLVEAEALLDKVDTTYVPGRKEALSGCLLAVQGECVKAKEMFSAAMAINPGVCIPDAYRSLCN